MDFRDYVQDQQLIAQFLQEYYIIDDNGEKVPKYTKTLENIANRDEVVLTVELADFKRFNEGLYEALTRNTPRYEQLFYQALDEILPLYKTKAIIPQDIMDVFIEQRQYVAQLRAQGANDTIENRYPPELLRRVEVSFKPSSFEPIPIRQVNAKYVGKLVTVRGIVIRESDVKPMIRVACYYCDQCGYETFQTIKDQEFTPLFQCETAVCKTSKSFGRLTKQIRGSAFTKVQEIKLQEHADQVPTGHIPRTITVMAYGEQTRRCSPGDHISVTGVFLTVEKTGYRLRTGGLSADTYIQAQYISQMNKSDDDELNVEPMTEEEAEIFVGNQRNFLSRLSSSIAPEIYGHEHLKTALLLLLVGGVDKNPNGMRIRGNINICIMGDPGVAKSQLLGFIDRLASRSQFTTGRGSSGVGLTAAVMKDPITGEMTLEGGALVLADKGICCIDEFDKMMDADRTAIHEVMEQQTVSIAKAGIMTTLNARVSILAAANPAYGRYNPNRLLTENLQLPPALLSRFDLLWLIRDLPKVETDMELARHVTNIHRNPHEAISIDSDVIDMKTMRRYMELCKTKNPVVPKELDQRLIDIYLKIRRHRHENTNKKSNDTLFTSPRSLLAIIRLSTAFARLRLADQVDENDVQAAVNLYEQSRASIENMSEDESMRARIRDLLHEFSRNQGKRELLLSDFIDHALSLDYSESDIDDALREMEKMDMVSVDRNFNELVIID